MKRLLFPLFLLCCPAFADSPVIENVSAKQIGNAWSFDVTLRHADTGWDDYADAWRILDMDGKELGIRPLAHPHVEEQPFTRSLSGVKLPADLREVQVQARDTVGGWSPEKRTVKLR